MSEPIDKDLPNEQQLDDYLKGGSSVSQQYHKLRSEEVPADLDRLVLSQAHDAVKSARPAKSRSWMRWTGPLALAASAVLVVSILIETGLEDEVMLSAPAPVAAPMEAKRERDEAADSDASGSAPVETHMMIEESAFAPEPASPPPPPQANRAPDFAAPKAVAVPEVPPPQMDVPAPPPSSALPTVAKSDRARSIRMVAPPPAQSPPAVAQTVDVSAFKEAQQALGRQGMTSTATQQNSAVQAREVAADAAAVAEEEKSHQLQQYSDAELWLRDIRQLRRENRKEAADKEWRRFRAQFPDYVVAEGDTAREIK